jgi:peptidoglycan/LPS O-acetylase OafA/YrhL
MFLIRIVRLIYKSTSNRYTEPSGIFEVGGRGRLLPMEGLRGIAVGLVFMQHYSTQYLLYGRLTGFTRSFSIVFSNIGNYGVELFFVLSGFLIHGMLLRNQPPFFSFMVRRAQRLYPAFLVALAIGAAADIWRPQPKIPETIIAGSAYLFENMAFLPGLLPIDPLFSVNWSLSYEWWFYVSATLLFSVCGIAAARPGVRICGIGGAIVVLLTCSAAGIPQVPVRGVCLLGGMLLAESREKRLPSVPGAFGIAAALAGLVACAAVRLPMPSS